MMSKISELTKRLIEMDKGTGVLNLIDILLNRKLITDISEIKGLFESGKIIKRQSEKGFDYVWTETNEVLSIVDL